MNKRFCGLLCAVVCLIGGTFLSVQPTHAEEMFRNIAIDQSTQKIYITSHSEPRVWVIDALTDSITHIIPITTPEFPSSIPAKTGDESPGETTNDLAENVNDLAENVNDIAVDETVGKIYVSHHNDMYASVSVIDGVTNTVTATIPVGQYAGDIGIDKKQQKIYVTDGMAGGVWVIDARTYAVSDMIHVGRYSGGIAIDETHQKAYVVASVDRSVVVIDTTTNTVVDTIILEHLPGDIIAINNEAKKIYVGALKSVIVIDTAKDTVDHTIFVNQHPYGYAVSEKTQKIYVAGSDTLSVINTATENIVTIPGAGGYGVAINENSQKIYVTQDAGVQVVDAANRKITNVSTS